MKVVWQNNKKPARYRLQFQTKSTLSSNKSQQFIKTELQYNVQQQKYNLINCMFAKLDQHHTNLKSKCNNIATCVFGANKFHQQTAKTCNIQTKIDIIMFVTRNYTRENFKTQTPKKLNIATIC